MIAKSLIESKDYENTVFKKDLRNETFELFDKYFSDPKTDDQLLKNISIWITMLYIRNIIQKAEYFDLITFIIKNVELNKAYNIFSTTILKIDYPGWKNYNELSYIHEFLESSLQDLRLEPSEKVNILDILLDEGNAPQKKLEENSPDLYETITQENLYKNLKRMWSEFLGIESISEFIEAMNETMKSSNQFKEFCDQPIEKKVLYLLFLLSSIKKNEVQLFSQFFTVFCPNFFQNSKSASTLNCIIKIFADDNNCVLPFRLFREIIIIENTTQFLNDYLLNLIINLIKDLSQVDTEKRKSNTLFNDIISVFYRNDNNNIYINAKQAKYMVTNLEKIIDIKNDIDFVDWIDFYSGIDSIEIPGSMDNLFNATLKLCSILSDIVQNHAENVQSFLNQYLS